MFKIHALALGVALTTVLPLHRVDAAAGVGVHTPQTSIEGDAGAAVLRSIADGGAAISETQALTKDNFETGPELEPSEAGDDEEEDTGESSSSHNETFLDEPRRCIGMTKRARKLSK